MEILAGRRASAAPAPPPIVAEAANYIVTPGDQVARFLLVLRVRRDASEGAGELRWPLPPGAVNARVVLPAGEPAVRVEGGQVTDARGLGPGEARDYTVRFELPLPREGVLATLPVAAPIRTLLVLVDPEGLAVGGVEGLRPGGRLQFQGRTLVQFGAEGVGPGAPIRFVLRPAARAGAALREAAARVAGNPWFLASLAFSLGATALVAGMRRRSGRLSPQRQAPPADVVRAAILGGAATADALPEPAASLVREIAELDLARADGRVEAGDYERVRAELKRRALAAAGDGPPPREAGG